jgi:hypothetical protein
VITVLLWAIILLVTALLTGGFVLYIDVKHLGSELQGMFRVLDRMSSRAINYDCQRRVDHLHIMRALKGESYAGQIGEFEVHTDESIPTGSICVYTPKSDDSDKVEDSSQAPIDR